MGKVAYELQLPTEMSTIHNVCHVSMLKKYINNTDHVLTLQTVQVQAYLTHEEKHVEILDCTMRSTRIRKYLLSKSFGETMG